MTTIAIIGNGPNRLLPNLELYKEEIDIWIGADRGAMTLLTNNIVPDYAVGDFDSINLYEKNQIKSHAKSFTEYPVEKDETDMEIAILKAYELRPDRIILFGVTGGRLDHAFVNLQLLYTILRNNIRGIIIDRNNLLELTFPGTHKVTFDQDYPNISLIPFSEHVRSLTLDGFYYTLEKQNISWGSTLCISNKLTQNNGTFSYDEGILLLIKSRDVISETIPM